MGLVDTLRSKGQSLAGSAMSKLFEDEKRAEKIGELFTLVQKGRKAVDTAQEAALRGMGVASSGELKATGKRLAQLRRSARQLDDKLSKLANAVGAKEND